LEFVKPNSTFFTLSLIIEGATEKALQFIMPLGLFALKTLVLLNKNVYLTTKELLTSRKLSLKWRYFCNKKCTIYLIRAALVGLCFLHKDALFHYDFAKLMAYLGGGGARGVYLAKL
jgi:hypothetical protein